jgi:hypothetical protein
MRCSVLAAAWSRLFALASLVLVLAGVRGFTAPVEDLDTGDLDVGQIGRIDTHGGKVTFYSDAENPIGDDEVIVVPRNKDGSSGRPFIIRRVDVKRFPPGKPVSLDGTFKVVATRNHKGRFRYVLEPVK